MILNVYQPINCTNSLQIYLKLHQSNIGFFVSSIRMGLGSQITSKRNTIFLDEQIECFQYNYMYHQKQEKESISVQLSHENPGAETSTLQTNQLDDAENKAKDEAKRKLITRNILSSSIKRLRRDQQQSDLMQEYMSQVLKMVGQLRFTRPSKLIRKDMSMEQIDSVIEELKESMENNVNRNNLKKKAILETMQNLERKELQNKEKDQQLMRARTEVTQRRKWLHYLMHIQDKISELEVHNINIQSEIESKEQKLHDLKEQIACKASESAIKRLRIQTNKENIQSLLQKQSQLQRQHVQLLSKKIPYRSEMIRCMFQVGILSEQNYLYSLKKKHKWSEKNIAASQTNEKFLKMYEHLKERTITIDCYKSLLIHIRTLSSIYIHCQSLAHQTNFISNYSYFSTQYKVFYNFQNYERYLNILVQKIRNNEKWTRLRDELHQDGSTASKLKIIIDARQEQVEFLRYILEVFLEERGYFIHLGEKKIRLELKADMNNKNENQQQSQICFLKMDLNNLGT